jgi:hypothetical protein
MIILVLFWGKNEYPLKGLQTTSVMVTLVESLSLFCVFFALGLADVFFFGDFVALAFGIDCRFFRFWLGTILSVSFLLCLLWLVSF